MVLVFCYLDLHKATGLCYGTVTSNSLQCPADPMSNKCRCPHFIKTEEPYCTNVHI